MFVTICLTTKYESNEPEQSRDLALLKSTPARNPSSLRRIDCKFVITRICDAGHFGNHSEKFRFCCRVTSRCTTHLVNCPLSVVNSLEGTVSHQQQTERKLKETEVVHLSYSDALMKVSSVLKSGLYSY